MGKSASNGKGEQKERLKTAAKRRRKLEEMQRRAHSEWCEVRESPIHGSGVYAAKPIPEGTRVIEYIGERIGKNESERRAWAQFRRARNHGEAAVFIFTLSKKWDLDGSVEWNTARLINHSCEPNCEAFVEKKRVFIYAMRDIAPGEELSFDYGFPLDSYEDHPCQCGTESCVGYIVVQDEWPKLRQMLEQKERIASKSNGASSGAMEGASQDRDPDRAPAAASTDGRVP